MISFKTCLDNRSLLAFSLWLTLLLNGCTTTSSTTPSSTTPQATPAQQTPAVIKPEVKPYKKPVKDLKIKAPSASSTLKTDKTAVSNLAVSPTQKSVAVPTKKPIVDVPAPAKASLSVTTTKKVSTPIGKPPVKKPQPKQNPKPTSKQTSLATKTVTTASVIKPKEQPTRVKTVQPTAPADTAERKIIEKLSVTLDALPIHYQDWIIDKPNGQNNVCILKTNSAKLKDGAGGTPVHLELDQKTFFVKTKSDVDLSYDSSQLLINSHSFKYDEVLTDTHAVIRNNLTQVLDALKASTLATVELGFWPSWPQTQTYQVNIPIQGFETAYNAWHTCNSIQ